MQTARTPEERVSFAQRLQDASARRAGLQAQFLIENRQAEFGDVQRDAQRRLAEIDADLATRWPGDPGIRNLQVIRQNVAARVGKAPAFTEEEITKPYRDAALEIANIQRTVIDPALKQSQDEARAMARAALDETNRLHGEIVGAWRAMGTDAGRAFRESFLDEYGRLPGFVRPQKQNMMPLLPSGARSGTTLILNGVDLSQHVSESAKQEIVAAAVGATLGRAGDRAMQDERRFIGTGGAVA